MRNSILFVIFAIFFLLFSPVTATIIIGQNTTIDPTLNWGIDTWGETWVLGFPPNLGDPSENDAVLAWGQGLATKAFHVQGNTLTAHATVPSPPPNDPGGYFQIMGIESLGEAEGWIYEDVDLQGANIEDVMDLPYRLSYDLSYNLGTSGHPHCITNATECEWSTIYIETTDGYLTLDNFITPYSDDRGTWECLDEESSCRWMEGVTSLSGNRHIEKICAFNPSYKEGMGLVEEIIYLLLFIDVFSAPEEFGGSYHSAQGTVSISNIELTWLPVPQPSFFFYPRNPEPGEPVVFDATESSDPDGTIEEYYWDFGWWQLGEGIITEHTFEYPGVYPVRLDVTDNEGISYHTTREITVGSPNFCTGKVEFLRQNYDDINGIASIVVTDDDLNQNPRISEEVAVTLQSFDTDTYGGSSYRQIGEKEVYLAEMGTNSNIFTNFVWFSPTGTDPLAINVSSYLPGYFKVIYIDKKAATGDTNVEVNATATYYFAAKVKGRVWDMDISAALGVSDIHPVTGAEVVMTKPGELLGGKRYTNENGFFEFEQVSPGTYNIDVTIRDQNGLIARTYSRQVEVRSAQTVWVEFPEHILEIMKMEYKTQATQDYVTLKNRFIFTGYCVETLHVLLNALTLYVGGFPATFPATWGDVVAYFAELRGDYLYGEVQQSFEEQAWMAIETLGAIADDPPDSAYAEVYPLVFPDPIILPPDYSGILTPSYVNLANLMADQNAIEKAILVSFERYQGALEVGEPKYMELQLGAIQQYALLMEEKDAQVQATIQILIGEVEANDQLYGDTLRDLQQRLAAEGFTAEEEQALRDLGFTRLDLDAYREFLLSLDPDLVLQGLQDMADVSQHRAESALSLSGHAGEVISYLENPASLLTSDFLVSPDSGPAPLTVQFNDTSMGDPTAWNWSFGDDTWFNTTIFDERNATKTYALPGMYTAQLTVSNEGGSNTTLPGTTITVTEPVHVPPVADAGLNQKVLVKELATFTGDGSSDPDGTIITYDWTFGDGNSGTGMVVTHAYTSGGAYTATLTVTDDSSLTASDTATITVLTPSQGVDELKQVLKDMHIKPTLETKLLSILTSSQKLINLGWNQQAVTTLKSFIMTVNYQRGYSLTNEQADELVAYTDRIIAVLS